MAYRLKTRFAPTPSGYMHVGNAWSLVLTWLVARSRGGHITLRIDDLDADRFREEYLEDIFASLEWLGLVWDQGPRDARVFKASFSQRLRVPRYRAAVEQLENQGKLYACVCSREEIRRHRETGNAVYPGTCRDKGLPAETENALRFRMGPEASRVRDVEGRTFELHPARDMGDFTIRRKNGDPSYQIASVADDQDMGINFIVRGLDLMPSTGAQLSLARTLGYREFQEARFWHHALVLDENGEKLSKSDGAVSLRALRARGGPGPLFRAFARYLAKESGRNSSAGDLLPAFDPGNVHSGPIRLTDFSNEGIG
jgi:glutamyl-tRNA synthetase